MVHTPEKVESFRKSFKADKSWPAIKPTKPEGGWKSEDERQAARREIWANIRGWVEDPKGDLIIGGPASRVVSCKAPNVSSYPERDCPTLQPDRYAPQQFRKLLLLPVTPHANINTSSLCLSVIYASIVMTLVSNAFGVCVAHGSPTPKDSFNSRTLPPKTASTICIPKSQLTLSDPLYQSNNSTPAR